MVSYTSLFVLLLTAVVAHESPNLRGLQDTPIAAMFKVAMLNAVNAERAKVRLPPLCYNSKLTTAAQLHSEDQASTGTMSHTGSKGSTMVVRINAQKFQWNGIGENVAAGQVDVAQVMNDWMNSPGHRANILGNYKYFGMGFAFNATTDFQRYWTQDFGLSNRAKCD